MVAYTVQVQEFEGPLDLLLHLVREEKMDIWNIDISLLADRFLDHLHRMEEMDLEIGGEFIMTCSELMRMKSRLLLPAEPLDEEDEEGDPRIELARRLEEYARFKEIAQTLKERMSERALVFGRPVDGDEGVAIPAPAVADVTSFDLYIALQRILQGRSDEEQEPARELEPQRLSVAEVARSIIARLRGEGTVSFEALAAEARTRIEVVVWFVALLELLRRRRIRIRQRSVFGEILISSVGDDGGNRQ
jgi:segregation and condensation protein A